ncbi:retrotransposon protein, putative, ty1-copia subclass [Tanacetum coccineum]
MFVIEQPLPAAPAADSATNVLLEWNAVYDAYNEVAYIILGSMTLELHRQFENSSPYDMMIIEALTLKDYVDQLERLEITSMLKWGDIWVKHMLMLIEYEKEDKCHYAHSILKGVVSVHRLVENGFVQRFTDFGISVSKNNVHYFNVIPSNGIYEIDMHNLVPNVNSIYNVSTKRAKHNLDSTYLWHYRLAHISKKRIEKIQHEGLLKSTYDESFDQCVSCLSGKMTRKSFPHRPERATDLLGIIHTDLTSPYTPQHKEVSERRNHTLLDMVRSMISLITLSLSFWDYALESTTCILNMVPTKNVDKTPYELWYGKVPNLSYLKVWGCEALVKRDMPDKLQ